MSDEWKRGFAEGYHAARDELFMSGQIQRAAIPSIDKPKRKRKLSAWQKYVKVNSKKPRFKYKSGSKKGRVNFKALGVAFRKTPAGRKKRR